MSTIKSCIRLNGLSRPIRFFKSALMTKTEHNSARNPAAAAKRVSRKKSNMIQSAIHKMPPFPKNVAVFMKIVSHVRRRWFWSHNSAESSHKWNLWSINITPFPNHLRWFQLSILVYHNQQNNTRDFIGFSCCFNTKDNTIPSIFVSVQSKYEIKQFEKLAEIYWHCTINVIW